MSDDQIDALIASHEMQLADQIEAAFLQFLATVNVDQLASALDDMGADHIRAQLAIILDLDDTGTPQVLSDGMGSPGALLASFVAAVAALASAQAKHSLNTNGTALASMRADAIAMLGRFLADTATAIGAAIESAIYGSGTPQARAAQLKRSLGLTVRQGASLDVMQAALQHFLDTPRTLTPARTDTAGIRIPPTYTRQANTRAILASTRGRISAAQRQLIARAMANPKLTQADADTLLDGHARAMRHFRIRAVSSEGIHDLAETGKLTGWRIAQRFGALPADQRRHWRTAGDERVRHTHAQVPGMNPGGVPLDQPFNTPFGKRMNAPLEWGCRCKATLGAAH
ncbi:hypothetical protein J2W22_002874 [Sphingomonas kyeonggiensis]|uniref:hypothetical protein n=1 Tax=Sphingomonas kyeonggiensis TaxID=1268553 RepID=UPI002784F5BE|nr:hypothetical protein [Sphingomonas kyeonggiensis]MDQ0250810.1 hypothetical protein [Sphingomonas kyeonggiensis]